MTDEEFAKLVKEVQEAQKRHEDMQEHARNASREATAALNLLNEAQKTFDKALDAIRGEASRESGWKRAEEDRKMMTYNRAAE